MAKPGRGFSPEAPEGVRFLEPELRLPVLFLAAQVRRLRWHSAATETRHEITAGRDQVPGDDRVALTDAAYDAIASTLPKGAARWPMQRDRGQCFIQVEAAVVDRMRAMRRPGESYSQVILRLVELETSDLK
jgi:hypothetical protein